MVNEEEVQQHFIESKNALLNHYSSQQTSQSARLVGLVIVLLTLLQAVATRLSNILSNFPVPPSFQALAPQSDALRVVFFIIVVTVIITLLIRTAGRFSVYGQLCSEVIYVTPNEIEEGENSLHEAIHRAAWERLKKRNPRFLGFKVTWFVRTGVKEENKEARKSWWYSIIVGIVIGILLWWFLW